MDIAIGGDCNSRIAALLPSFRSYTGPYTFFRSSTDTCLNARGRHLLKLCGDYNLLPLNASRVLTDPPLPGNNGGPTSFKPGGSAVVDYMMVSLSFDYPVGPTMQQCF